MAVLGLAAALRIHDVSGKNLWIDEANGVLMSRGGLAALVAHLKLDSSPPLYYMLLGGWMRLFGDSEAAVRSLSIVFGVLLTGSVWAVGRRLFGTETGLVAAVLTALAPTQICYSQQARMYSLLALLGLLSSYWLWRAIEDGRSRFFVAYALAMLAALYTHNFALHLLPAHAVVVIWSGACRRALRRWIVCAAAIVIGYLPWLPVFLAQLGNTVQYGQFAARWRSWGPWHAWWITAFSFAPGDPHPLFTLANPPRTIWPPVLLFVLAVLIGVTRVVRQTPGGLRPAPRPLWLVSAAFLPLVAAVVTSTLSTPNYAAGRVDQMVFPLFALLGALGLTTLRTRVTGLRPVLALARYGLLLVLAYYSYTGLKYWYGNQFSNGDRAIARRIAQSARPGDAVLCTSLTRAPLEYYLDRMGTPVRFYSYPREVAKHMGNHDPRGWLRQPGRLQREIRQVEKDMRLTCGAAASVIAVIADEPVNDRLVAHLSSLRGSQRLNLPGEFQQSGSGIAVNLWLAPL